MSKPRARRWSRFFDPGREIPADSFFWYGLAVAFLGAALYFAWTGSWQHGAEYVRNPATGAWERTADARSLSLVPTVASAGFAVLLYASLLVRRCVRNFSNLWTFVLILGDWCLMSTLIESFLPAKEVVLFNFLGWDAVRLSPMQLLMVLGGVSWLGLRALAGAVFWVLVLACLARFTELNAELGVAGTCFILCGASTLLIQAKLPYMIPEGGWLAALRQDFGLLGADLHRNSDRTKAVVASAARALGAAEPPSILTASADDVRAVPVRRVFERGKPGLGDAPRLA